MPGHFHAAHDGAGEKALADCARTAAPAFCAVRGITPTEVVALHNTFKPTAFCDADGIDKIALGENGGSDDIARLDWEGEIAEFADALGGGCAEFFEMSHQRLGHAMLLLIVKAQLDGVVAIRLDGLGLNHTIGAGENDSDRNQYAASVIDACLAEFFS